MTGMPAEIPQPETVGTTLYEAFVCPTCLGSFNVVSDDPDEMCECLGCQLLAPLWYLRLVGVHECERDDLPEIFERHRSVPHIDADGREWGRTRRLDDYAEVRAMLAAGYEWQPE